MEDSNRNETKTAFKRKDEEILDADIKTASEQNMRILK